MTLDGVPAGEKDPLYDQAGDRAAHTASFHLARAAAPAHWLQPRRAPDRRHGCAGMVSPMQSNGNREVLVPRQGGLGLEENPPGSVVRHSASVEAAAIERFKSFVRTQSARRLRAESPTTAAASLRRRRRAVSSFSARACSAGLRQAGRPAHRRRRPARVDLRPRPQPGNGAQTRMRSAYAGGAARRVRRHRKGVRASMPARRMAWSGSRQDRASARPGSSACAWDSMRRTCVRWNFDHFGQTTRLQFSNLRRNPKVDKSEFRFEPPKGADVLGKSERSVRQAGTGGCLPRSCGRSRSTRWSASVISWPEAAAPRLRGQAAFDDPRVRRVDNRRPADGESVRRRVHRAVGGVLGVKDIREQQKPSTPSPRTAEASR